MKRHARTLPDPGRLLWVGDEADWAVMRGSAALPLVCPQPGCGDRLHAVCNSRGTRFLRRTAGGAGCPHWLVAGRGHGPESTQHLWMKARLASICLRLGWAAVPEDPATHADVWLPDARLALEVQLRRTDTLARTAARLAAGAEAVVWFFGAEVPAAGTLFRSPAVRFDVVDAEGGGRPVQPWTGVGGKPRLVVFGTVWQWRDWRLATGRMSAYTFLSELLAGTLGWCPPGTPGFPPGRGGWVRWSDLAVALGVPSCADRPAKDMLAVPLSAWIEQQLRKRAARGAGRAAGTGIAGGLPDWAEGSARE